MSDKLWGGRFSEETSPLLRRFNDSLPFDRKMWQADIRGSVAYAKALARAGLISAEEQDQLLSGLQKVWQEWADGVFAVQPGDEDIHTAVERRLTELVGSVGGKLHTGRSRNDQVATDMRLYLLAAIDELEGALTLLQTTTVTVAGREIDLLMPGYTHLQPAQPVRFSHWLLAYFWMWQRDWERLRDLRRRVSVLPLGSGALAGTPFSIDRESLAADLGFDAISANSIDAVSDRDFAIEFLSWAALLGVHLSRIAEDLILWSSREFGFVTLSDAYSTGSSLMPQKKNPDSLELLRGKSARLIGNLTQLLVVLKGLPTAYDKDLQEDKESLFDSVETVSMSLAVMAGVLETLTLHRERMRAALADELLATELADYLVRKGVPFRESHHLVGQVVRLAEEREQLLSVLPLAALQRISPYFGEDVAQVWDQEAAVERKAVTGGTARAAVQQQLQQARQLLAGRSATPWT